MLILIIMCYNTWWDLYKSAIWIDDITRNFVNWWYDWKIKSTNEFKLLDRYEILGFLSFHCFSFVSIIFLLLTWLANYVVSIATSIDRWNNESHSNSPAVKSLMLTSTTPIFFVQCCPLLIQLTHLSAY